MVALGEYVVQRAEDTVHQITQLVASQPFDNSGHQWLEGCVVSIGNVQDDLCVGAHVAQNIRNGGGLCRAYHIVRTVVETALYFV